MPLADVMVREREKEERGGARRATILSLLDLFFFDLTLSLFSPSRSIILSTTQSMKLKTTTPDTTLEEAAKLFDTVRTKRAERVVWPFFLEEEGEASNQGVCSRRAPGEDDA